MVLLLQLNGELPDRFPGHERRLYVFSCRRKSCRRKEGSIRAVRGMKISAEAVAAAAKAKEQKEKENRAKEEAEAKKAAAPGLGDALFGGKGLGAAGGSGMSNPFSTGGGGGAGANPFAKAASPFGANPFSTAAKTPGPETKPTGNEAEDIAKDLPKTFAETLSLNNTQKTSGPPPAPEPWPTESEQPKPFPVSYLADADYETLDPIPLPKQKIDASVMEIDDGSGAGSSGKEDKDTYESTMDSTFQKFADRVGQNPEQCIRYEFAGQPLLYNKNDDVGKKLHDVGSKGIPRCGNCGCERTFEVQLTPQAIAELEANEDGLDGMDWGTVIVGVCGADCQEKTAEDGEAGYLEEWAGVQWEDLVSQR